MSQTLAAVVAREIKRRGLLLLSDPELPSLVTMLTGAPVKGSWWGHPRGNLIYNTAVELMELADITSVKLVNGKVTFVHRRLWPALITVARSQEGWQVDRLSKPAQKLLGQVAKKKVRASTPAQGKLAKELESRLLVYCEDVHTEKGTHWKELRSWGAFAKSRKLKLPKLTVARAQEILHNAADSLSDDSDGLRVALPWQKRR